MASPKSVSTLLVLLGLSFLLYGLFCFASPGFLAEAAGVTATTPTGTVELRAMYGGLQAAFGVLLLAGVRDPRFTVAALAAAAFVMPGLAISRLLAAAVGGFSAYTLQALVFEITASVFAVMMLRRQLAAE